MIRYSLKQLSYFVAAAELQAVLVETLPTQDIVRARHSRSALTAVTAAVWALVQANFSSQKSINTLDIK